MRNLTLSNTAKDRWIAVRKRRPNASLRLFCFPYAGGSATIFHNWSNSLPSFIEVCPIQLPGRGVRISEKPFTSMSLLVDAISTAISTYLDKPFALFGHSMGALVSFYLCHKLRDVMRLEPAHLFVSGRRAPQIPRRDPSIFNLPEREFIDELRRLDGTPPEMFENAELLHLLLPMLRADFELNETSEYVARPQLTCPITALGGIGDKDVKPEDLQAWGKESSGNFDICMFSGGHFFLRHQETQVLGIIAERLAHLAVG